LGGDRLGCRSKMNTPKPSVAPANRDWLMQPGRRRVGRPRTHLQRQAQCVVCSAWFEVEGFPRKSSPKRGRYCSDRCKRIGQSAKPKHCKICRAPYFSENIFFCSLKCRRVSDANKQQTVVCRNCLKISLVKVRRDRPTPLFCNRACWHKFLAKTHPKRGCGYCGKPVRKKNARFCTFKCLGKWRKGRPRNTWASDSRQSSPLPSLTVQQNGCNEN